MNKIKFFTVLGLILICAPLLSQNHYVVQWDRLKNDVSYFKVEYQNGKRVESATKKPFLKEGDILEGKMINVNEFVFKPVITVNKKKLNTEQNFDVLGNVLGGLGLLNMGSGLFGVLSEVVNLKNEQSKIIFNSDRGSESVNSEQEQVILNWEKQLAADIKTINSELNTISSAKVEFENLDKIIHAEDLDLIEFKTKANSQIIRLKEIDLSNSLSIVESSILDMKEIFQNATQSDNIEDLNPELKVNSQKLIDFFNNIDVNNIVSNISNDKLNELAKEIESADFMCSQKQLINSWEPEGSYGSDPVAVDETIFNIDFQVYQKNSNTNDDSENNNSYQSLVSHKVVSVNTESPLRPNWSTGIVFHFPMNQYNQVKNRYNYDRDSISFAKGDAIPGGTAISTHLMFEFGNFEKFIPNFSLGVSYKINEFLKEEDSYGPQTVSSNMSILLGGGIRSRGFRFFSLNAGISWSQIQVLNENLELGTSYDVYDLEDSGITSSDYFTDKWKPSFYVGVGFHF